MLVCGRMAYFGYDLSGNRRIILYKRKVDRLLRSGQIVSYDRIFLCNDGSYCIDEENVKPPRRRRGKGGI